MKLPRAYEDRTVCIIGLGYVGLTLAVAMAEAGFEVFGVERDPAIVQAISNEKAHFIEAGLDARLSAQVKAGRITASQDWPAPGRCRVFIITVGTPLDSEGTTNLAAIRQVAAGVAKIMRDGALIVLRSTVRVGVSRESVKPILDATDYRYDLAFCPERTLEGRALQELRSLPQIIGGLDDEAAVRASHMFNFITPTTVRVKDLETAEMIKLINNTQRDLMFAFANEVADICDAIGVSAVDVITAGNMGYPRGSMPLPGPVGGPCLEKDPYILAEGVQRRGGRSRLALLGRTINEELPDRAVRRILEAFGARRPAKISIMGLAFKGRPETSDLRGSLVVPLIDALRRQASGAQIVGHDPMVDKQATRSLGIDFAADAATAFDQADCVVFQNNSPRFQLLDMPALSQTLSRDAFIYDLWNQFDFETLALRSDVRYFGFGTRVLLRKPDTAVETLEVLH